MLVSKVQNSAISYTSRYSTRNSEECRQDECNLSSASSYSGPSAAAVRGLAAILTAGMLISGSPAMKVEAADKANQAVTTEINEADIAPKTVRLASAGNETITENKDNKTYVHKYVNGVIAETKVTWPDGTVEIYTYNEDGKITNSIITYADKRVCESKYNDGKLVSVDWSYQDGSSEAYTYDDKGKIASYIKINKDGSKETSEYSKGVLTNYVVESEGYTEKNEYENGKLAKMTKIDEKAGTKLVYTYDKKEKMLTSYLEDTKNKQKEWGKYTNGVLTEYKIKYSNGSVYLATYDKKGKMLTTTQTYKSGKKEFAQYTNGVMRKYTITDPKGKKTKEVFDYDKNKILTKSHIEYKTGKKEDSTYYKNGRVKKLVITYPNGKKETYVYTEDGKGKKA